MRCSLFGSSDAVPAAAGPPGCANRILCASRAVFMEIGLEVSKTLENALDNFGRSIAGTTRGASLEKKRSYFSYC